MPIDITAGSNIPLSGTPAPPSVAPESLLDAFGKAQAIRNSRQAAVQSAATNAQALASGAIDLQQKQQDLTDQQIYAAALKRASQPPPGSPPGTPIAPADPNLVTMYAMQDQRGLSGKGALALMQNNLAIKEKNAEITQKVAAAHASDADSMAKRADAITGATQNLINLASPDDPGGETKRAAAWSQFRQQLIDSGNLTEAQIPVSYPSLAWVQQAHDGNQAGQAQLAAQKQASDIKIAQEKATRDAAMGPPLLAKAQNEVATTTPNANGLTPEQQQQADQAKAQQAETQRHNLSDESNAKLNTAIARGQLAQTQLVNGMKYGAGTQEYWVQQLQQNPDSIKDMPPELRTVVGQQFTKATGLPLPMQVNAATQTQETAARSALENATRLKSMMTNPLISSQIGPLLGRLGNVDQAIGTATGLSPEGERLGQEFRTLARYNLFTEGKALLGGRLPQQLMDQLEKSSANSSMDANLFSGALDGMTANARTVMDSAEKQRFGGKMRTPAMRGIAAPAAGGNVPAAVKALLGAGSVKPGIHKLSDGSSWMKAADGTLSAQ